MHAQLEIWKAAYVDAADSNHPLTSTLGTSAVSTSNGSLSQTSIWNQMLNEDSDISDGMRIFILKLNLFSIYG